VHERKGKKENGDDIKKKNSNGYYSIAVFYIIAQS